MRDNSSRFEVPQEEPQEAKAVDLMSFAAPTQFVTLPSKGKYYPEGHPLKDQESIEVKFMTAKEEDILASQELIKKGVVLDRLIDSLIIDKRLRATDLLVGDRAAIMYAARISAYGPEYQTKFFCRSCSNAVEHEFDLEEIREKEEADFEDLGAEWVDGHWTCVLPSTGVTVAMRLLDGKDEQEIAKFTKKNANRPQGLGALATQLLFIIHSINGETGKAAIMNFVQNMPMRDSKYLRKVHAEVSPSLNTEMEIVCDSCGADQEVELPLSVEFFWPKQ